MHQQPITRVNNYVYLGTNLNEDWDHSREVKQRIEKTRASFSYMSNIFKSHDLSTSIKIRLLRCYIFSVLLYGVESWTLTESSMKNMRHSKCGAIGEFCGYPGWITYQMRMFLGELGKNENCHLKSNSESWNT